MSIEALLVDQFYHDGRGPTLQRVQYSPDGSHIIAVEYLNPDAHGSSDLKHLLLRRAQTFMFTPEEVVNYVNELDWAQIRPAAIVRLGKSPWLQSFSQRHLARCDHYRIMFYDQFLDVICEGVEVRQGTAAAR